MEDIKLKKSYIGNQEKSKVFKLSENLIKILNEFQVEIKLKNIQLQNSWHHQLIQHKHLILISRKFQLESYFEIFQLENSTWKRCVIWSEGVFWLYETVGTNLSIFYWMIKDESDMLRQVLFNLNSSWNSSWILGRNRLIFCQLWKNISSEKNFKLKLFWNFKLKIQVEISLNSSFISFPIKKSPKVSTQIFSTRYLLFQLEFYFSTWKFTKVVADHVHFRVVYCV